MAGSGGGHEALITAASGGDPAATAMLLRAVQPDIRRYARRSCRTAADVDDAVQEVLWIVHRRAASLGAIASLGGWLCVVVQRLCRRLAVTAAAPLTGDWPLAVPRLADDDQDLRLDLAAAIAALPVDYRTVLLLRDVEALTIAEIAARLGSSSDSVKMRLRRARQRVRQALTAPA